MTSPLTLQDSRAFILSLENCIKAGQKEPALVKAGAVVIPLAFVNKLIEHFKQQPTGSQRRELGHLIQGELDRIRGNSLLSVEEMIDQARSWIDTLSNLGLVGSVFIENELLHDKVIERT